MKITKSIQTLLIPALFLSLQLYSQPAADNWPNWRGLHMDGVSPRGNPPYEWSETKNIKWKTPIPGKGLGTPVVWGDQIFISTAIELDQKATEEAIKRLKKTSPTFVKVLGMSGTTEHFLQFAVYAIHKNTGEVLWHKVVREQYPHEGINNNGSWASASCVTDGKRVVASMGSYGIYCFDMQGNLIWENDLGDMKIVSAFGEGSTPFIYKDRLMVVWDHKGPSKMFGLDMKTGAIVWQKDREELGTWVSPIVVEHGGKAQVIVPGNLKSIAYDAANGNTIWELAGLGDGPISCPISDGKTVILMSGFGKIKTTQAVDLQGASGDLADTKNLLWTSDKSPSYVPSPMLHEGKLYFINATRPQLSCVDLLTGSYYYEAVKLTGLSSIYASPVWAKGRVYILDRKGNALVIDDRSDFKVMAQNKLDDKFDASPVVVGDMLLLRGHKNLYCILE